MWLFDIVGCIRYLDKGACAFLESPGCDPMLTK